VIDAFHLPALADPPTTAWSYGPPHAPVELRIPTLTPDLLARQIEALLRARSRSLADRPVAEIVDVISSVAGRLLDRNDELRRTAESVLPLVTGASPDMVGLVLDNMAADWRRDRLQALLAADLGDAAALDGFVDHPRQAHPRVRVTAVGPRLATHVFSGNIPGIAVTSLVRSLLVKAATLGKTAVGDPLLPALFARAIAEADPELGECLAVAYWRGGDEALERVALDASDAVIVYGGNDTIAAIRARTPARARFLGYGHKLSFGLVAREALTTGTAEALAEAAALAVATFDQQGCVSPHLFYVESGGETSPDGWARMVAGSLQRLERELPRGAITPEESAAIRQARGAAEFAHIAGAGVELHASSSGTGWTVIYDPDPAFDPSCLNRLVRVKPVADVDEVAGRVAGIGEYLQTVGLAGPDDRFESLSRALADAGASRIAPVAGMAWPPPAWHHDGRPPIAELVRWCDWE
jgi:hypothetical protein